MFLCFFLSQTKNTENLKTYSNVLKEKKKVLKQTPATDTVNKMEMEKKKKHDLEGEGGGKKGVLTKICILSSIKKKCLRNVFSIIFFSK